MIVRRVGLATLYLADNAEVMPTLDRPTALIGDPPYGQRHTTNVAMSKKTILRGMNRRSRTGIYHGGKVNIWPDSIKGDDQMFDPSPWLHAADVVLLWGAHKFADRLPAGSWLIWDKVPTGKIRDQGDGEAAWLNGAMRPLRIHRLLWDGICVGSAARHEVTAGQPRVHPTQKPESLMAWCIQQARVPAGGMILDPWMGAGSTGIAAVKAGHPFVGIECEPLYFETACRRLDEAQRMCGLFQDAAE